MMKTVKCCNCGKRLFDAAALGIIETKCPKCSRIISVEIRQDNLGKIEVIQKTA